MASVSRRPRRTAPSPSAPADPALRASFTDTARYRHHALYRSLSDHVSVCDYCAGAFHVEDDVEAAPVSLDGGFEGHPSVRDLVADGYEVITY